MSDLPHFRQGQNLKGISARQLNRLVRAIQKLQSPQPSGGLTALHGPGGIQLAQVDVLDAPSRPTRPVAITEAGSEKSPMQIREVAYADLPPVEGEYRWGEPSPGYPEIGKRWNDYDGFVWPHSAPNLNTPILQAEMTDGFWIVVHPKSTELQLVVVRTLDEESDSTLMQASLVTLDKSGTLFLDEEAFEVHCWPGLLVRDYAALAQPDGTDVTDFTDVLDAWRWRGRWLVVHKYRIAQPMIDPAIRRTDCLPAI